MEPVLSAKAAGLHYVSDKSPGIRRLGAGKTFRYLNLRGKVIRDPETLRRIQRLAIPPAWRDVWISPDPEGHLQAVGRDTRGRKQYRYHPQWREIRDSTKYHRMYAFGRALPKIRSRVSRDLKKTGLPREKVLATIIRLLEETSIRVGNEEYTKQNQSFGLTTLRNRHVDIHQSNVCFYFRGKSGVRHNFCVEDGYLAKIVRHLRDLPGYELFQYIDDDGETRSIDSSDVNNYIREITGEEFTSKDFRTWNATVLAASALCAIKPFRTKAQAKKNIVAAVESVAKKLGNTVSVCRKCYIHPALFDSYMAQTLTADLKTTHRARGLSAEEYAVLCFLKKASKVKRKPALEESLIRSIRKMTRAAA